jgi:hypothetical protein
VGQSSKTRDYSSEKCANGQPLNAAPVISVKIQEETPMCQTDPPTSEFQYFIKIIQ